MKKKNLYVFLFSLSIYPSISPSQSWYIWCLFHRHLKNTVQFCTWLNPFFLVLIIFRCWWFWSYFLFDIFLLPVQFPICPFVDSLQTFNTNIFTNNRINKIYDFYHLKFSFFFLLSPHSLFEDPKVENQEICGASFVFYFQFHVIFFGVVIYILYVINILKLNTIDWRIVHGKGEQKHFTL